MSRFGQLMEHSPYCERDIRPPQDLKTYDLKGDYLIKAKKRGMMYGLHYGTHPFDVIGWDGCCYPYIFSIHDFEPITVVCTNRRLYIRLSRQMHLLFALLCRGYSIIIRRQFLRRTIIVILIAMN
jgi:hypothetical protein